MLMSVAAPLHLRKYQCNLLDLLVKLGCIHLYPGTAHMVCLKYSFSKAIHSYNNTFKKNIWSEHRFRKSVLNSSLNVQTMMAIKKIEASALTAVGNINNSRADMILL